MSWIIADWSSSMSHWSVSPLRLVGLSGITFLVVGTIGLSGTTGSSSVHWVSEPSDMSSAHQKVQNKIMIKKSLPTEISNIFQFQYEKVPPSAGDNSD